MEPQPSSRTPWLIAAGTFILLMLLSGRYGYHRDELYFIAAGERLAWGYVDQPPLTPLIARLSAPFDYALPALRLIPALAIAGVVAWGGAFARNFGGGGFAQGLTALTIACAGVFLAVGHILSTTTVDVLIWVALLWLVIRIVDTGNARLWPLVGVVTGIGLLNKWTVLFVVGALVASLLFSEHRRLLFTPAFTVACAIALLLWAPNLWWQATNEWPFFEMAESLRAEGLDDANSVLFVPMQLALIGPVAAPIWIAGLRRLWNSRHRYLVIAFALLALAFIALASKPYFLAPLYVPVLAAGAVAIEGFVRRRSATARRTVVGAIAAGGVIGAIITLPLLPAGVVADTPIAEINPDAVETYGWPSYVDAVEQAYSSLTEEQRATAAVFTSNYGGAGAVDLLGEARGLPAAASAHNNHYLWGPPSGAPVIIVGHFSDEFLAGLFDDVEQVGTVDNPVDLENEEFGAGVWIAQAPRPSWIEIWHHLKHYE